jgi:pimeloyl-ACP methyl ester carboxylesterase
MAAITRTHQGTTVASITLRDGRRLAYYEYGDPAGKPIFYFHGSQSSRLERHPDELLARSSGARIISIDRPGHGLSDFQENRRLLDWPDDVCALADRLGIERFAVMGMSAGGPYVLACAHEIPHRLTHATIVASFAPQDQKAISDSLSPQLRSMFGAARTMPWLIRMMTGIQRRSALSNPEKALAGLMKIMSPADQAMLSQPAIRAIFAEMFSECYRMGSRGAAWELSGILVKPWGFQLQDITVHVSLWQGETDQNVPVAWGRYLAQTLPNCRAHFLPGEGHLLIFNHFEAILAEIMA